MKSEPTIREPISTETSPASEWQKIGERGLNFRPCSDFANDGEYFHQFLWLARPKLTKKLFFQLPAGFYVRSNVGGIEAVIAPESERAAQWESVYPGARQRLCMIYRNKAHYEAMLEQGRKIAEENKENGIERKTKSSGQSGSAGQSVVLTTLQVMSFAMQSVPGSTQAIKLVFKLAKGIPESEFNREIPRLAIESIKACEISGKIEFLTGNNSNGDFVLCAGFEPFEILPDTARGFNARMTSGISIAAHKGGNLKLNKAQCVTEELNKLRGEYAYQGRFIFTGGKMIGHSAPADADVPDDDSSELYEAVNNYADNCAGVAE